MYFKRKAYDKLLEWKKLYSNWFFQNNKLYLSDTALFVTLMFIDRPVTENDIYAKLLSDKMR